LGRKRTKTICKYCLHKSDPDHVCCCQDSKSYGKRVKLKHGCDKFEAWKKE